MSVETTGKLGEELYTRLAEDPELAWGWHCNIAIPIMDGTGCSHAVANKTAANLMQHLFGVDMSKNETYRSMFPND